jgi:hypothetical protein
MKSISQHAASASVAIETGRRLQIRKPGKGGGHMFHLFSRIAGLLKSTRKPSLRRCVAKRLVLEQLEDRTLST